ncbi:hypothetical protein H696_04734 [Fonticula alba]|uniref:ENTH domain-containing protein n=1 Tax=Fonticula alba TaxID=691883 RepID=A0A058Z2G3_FONAL|nr:hypothetical protein H696_04734 [Fonticula alba]KCV68440.1 hypothetical protein H696_04734 [Fonticula alba]|eukprot:XP_009496872.1 hypothetical protein H696_04734 [Fonticula alba]
MSVASDPGPGRPSEKATKECIEIVAIISRRLEVDRLLPAIGAPRPTASPAPGASAALAADTRATSPHLASGPPSPFATRSSPILISRKHSVSFTGLAPGSFEGSHAMASSLPGSGAPMSLASAPHLQTRLRSQSDAHAPPSPGRTPSPGRAFPRPLTPAEPLPLAAVHAAGPTSRSSPSLRAPTPVNATADTPPMLSPGPGSVGPSPGASPSAGAALARLSRQTYKTMLLVEYLLRAGSPGFVSLLREESFAGIDACRWFVYVDADHVDHGAIISRKATDAALLLRDPRALANARAQFASNQVSSASSPALGDPPMRIPVARRMSAPALAMQPSFGSASDLSDLFSLSNEGFSSDYSPSASASLAGADAGATSASTSGLVLPAEPRLTYSLPGRHAWRSASAIPRHLAEPASPLPRAEPSPGSTPPMPALSSAATHPESSLL